MASSKPPVQNPVPRNQNLKPEISDEQTEVLETPQFVQEELPADFWGQETVPVTYADENIPPDTLSTGRPLAKASSSSPIKHPLFAELQSLFPGRILRIETTKTETKTGDDTKDEIEPTSPVDQSLDESEIDSE